VLEGSDIVSRNNENIGKDPNILGGFVVFRGTPVPFKKMLDYLEGSYTLDQFVDEFPSVRRKSAIAALERAKRDCSQNGSIAQKFVLH
jgi:uncharacterized protein (DUF433 family)